MNFSSTQATTYWIPDTISLSTTSNLKMVPKITRLRIWVIKTNQDHGNPKETRLEYMVVTYHMGPIYVDKNPRMFQNSSLKWELSTETPAKNQLPKSRICTNHQLVTSPCNRNFKISLICIGIYIYDYIIYMYT